MESALSKASLQGQKKWLFRAFFLNLLLAAAVFLPYIIQDKGIFLIAADFDAEQLSYNMLCNRAVKQGEVLWNWKIDIGSDLVSSFSFYNLGSPFFWITLLFPASFFPYLVGWVFMLKYAVAGLTSFLCFRREVSERSALIACVLYAFSGFSSTVTVFYHFHDVVAFFPLLVLGLDLLAQEGKKVPFLFAVAVNALLNYYFFISEVIFLVLYYLIRYLLCGWRSQTLAQHLKQIGACLADGVLGVGIAGVLFVPSVIAVLKNPRVSNRISLSELTFNWENNLQLIRALFFPADNMYSFSAGMGSNWYSIAAYLPMVGVSLVIAYVLCRKKDWLCWLLYACVVIALCPVLNSTFVMFTSEPYRRWFYMFVFFMALATAKVLDEPHRYPCRVGCFVSLAVIAGVTAYFLYRRDLIHRLNYWVCLTGLAFLGTAVLLFLLWKKPQKTPFRGMLAGVAVFAVATTSVTLYAYRSFYSRANSDMSTRDIYNTVVGTGDGLEDQLPYRYCFWEFYNNRGMAAYVSERSSFLSTLSPSIFEFYSAVDYGRHTISPEGPEGTNELLSVGYYVRCDDNWVGELYATYSNGYEQIYVYKDENALPIGFCYDTYMTRSEFDAIDQPERAHAMLKTLVVADEDEATVSAVLRHYDAAVDGEICLESKADDIEKRREACSETFAYGTDYFTSTITTDSEQYAFFSVPYDDSWSAEVNGKAAEILNINGLMAVKVEAGANEITFHYSPTPLWVGIGVSAASLLLTALYLLADRRKRRKVQVQG